METIIYVDQDGVLAKFQESASDEETHEIGFFESRERELSALSLVRLLKDAGVNVKILTSVYVDDHSMDEKRKWADLSGLADIPIVFVPYGESKWKYVDEKGNNILIDDYSKNLRQWEKKGFTAVKFFNDINGRPKITITDDNAIIVKPDSWTGYSIDYRMTPKQMFTVVMAIANENK